MGVTGAAIATVIGNLVACSLLTIFIRQQLLFRGQQGVSATQWSDERCLQGAGGKARPENSRHMGKTEKGLRLCSGDAHGIGGSSAKRRVGLFLLAGLHRDSKEDVPH